MHSINPPYESILSPPLTRPLVSPSPLFSPFCQADMYGFNPVDLANDSNNNNDNNR